MEFGKNIRNLGDLKMSGFSTERDVNDVPIGFSMSMMKSIKAMNAYASMNDDQKRAIAEEARNVKSEQEMDQLIEKLGTFPL